jgi:hypothetical protein
MPRNQEFNRRGAIMAKNIQGRDSQTRMRPQIEDNHSPALAERRLSKRQAVRAMRYGHALGTARASRQSSTMNRDSNSRASGSIPAYHRRECG